MKRKATTKEEVAVETFETIKASFLDDVFLDALLSWRIFLVI